MASAADSAEYDAFRTSRIMRWDASKPKPRWRSFTGADDYVEYRNRYFNSAAAYEEAANLADAEYDAPGTWQQRVGQTSDTADARKILYRWLRMAYLRRGVIDPPALIRTGEIPELREKTNAIRASHPEIRLGGFVARPQKLNGYKLGTLSEHGTGRAVDVVPQSENPHLTRQEWELVETLANRRVDNSKPRWKSDPMGLWRDIDELSSRYAAVLRSAASAGSTVADIVKDSPTLRDTAETHGADHGIFSLDAEYVEAFAEQGMLWGATFPDPDLHHFELEADAEAETTTMPSPPSPSASADLSDALATGFWRAAIEIAAAGGIRDVNQLTNLVFYARHPEMLGRKIAVEERALAKEWIAIRDEIVLPALED
jgi:hypothetical protein